jgi:hypothetical protein
MTVIQRLPSTGVPFSGRHMYLRGWRSHHARLNEFMEALSSGSLPMPRLFLNYGAQSANFEYQLNEVCFNGSDDEILKLFAFLDGHGVRQWTFHKFGTDCDELFLSAT